MKKRLTPPPPVVKKIRNGWKNSVEKNPFEKKLSLSAPNSCAITTEITATTFK
jgi:hypothetical protein